MHINKVFIIPFYSLKQILLPLIFFLHLQKVDLLDKGLTFAQLRHWSPLAVYNYYKPFKNVC